MSFLTKLYLAAKIWQQICNYDDFKNNCKWFICLLRMKTHRKRVYYGHMCYHHVNSLTYGLAKKYRRKKVYIEVSYNKFIFIWQIRRPCLCSCYQNLVIAIVTYIYCDFYAEISIKNCSICWILHRTSLRIKKIHWIYSRQSHSLFPTWLS